ncbi:7350_t:CDS:1, partial [Cetraspora pellucida]
MQNNEELSADLLDPYKVLFFSQTPDEFFENDDFDSDANIVELTNKTDAITLDNKNQLNKEKAKKKRKEHGNKEEKNMALEKKAKIFKQLPVLSNFSYLKHNVSFHQGFIQLASVFPDNNISSYELIRLFFLQTISNTILTNTNEYAQSKYASLVKRSWLLLTLDELKIWLGIVIYMGVIKLSKTTDYWSINP